MSILTELKRRKVVRVAVVYAVVAWGVAQVAELTVSTFGAPEWVMQVLVVMLLLGLPIAVVLAWAFEVTPDGVRRTTGAPAPGSADEAGAGAIPRGGSAWLSPRSLGVILLFAMMGLGGWYIGHSTARDGGFNVASIAVLPFSDLSSDGANRAFTDGLHDDLLTQLSRIAALRVTSRTSVQEYRGSAKSIPTIARELGVAAVLEGGVQPARGARREPALTLLRAICTSRSARPMATGASPSTSGPKSIPMRRSTAPWSRRTAGICSSRAAAPTRPTAVGQMSSRGMCIGWISKSCIA